MSGIENAGNPDKNIFYMSSSGSTATAWLTKVIDIHPQVKCWHGLIDMPGLPAQLSKKELVEKLCGFSEESNCFAGSVHLYPWHGVELKAEIESVGGRFCGLIRNPIMRMSSQYLSKRSDISAERYITHLNSFTEASPVIPEVLFEYFKSPPPTSIVVMVYAVWTTLFMDAQLLTLPSERVFCFEDYTSDPEIFSALLNYITKDKIEITREYLDQVFSYGHVNRHHEAAPKSSGDIYQAWNEDERFIYTLFLTLFERREKLVTRYSERFQYEMIFEPTAEIDALAQRVLDA